MFPVQPMCWVFGGVVLTGWRGFLAVVSVPPALEIALGNRGKFECCQRVYAAWLSVCLCWDC
jgi:hypothetical protein